jgi:hypothetical protein
MTLMATIEVRTALPTAMPTPDLEERPEHVARRQEEMEIVVVGALGLPVVRRRDESRCGVGGEQADDVERDHRHQAGDHPGGDQEGQARDAHHLQGVDLLRDPHRPELRREAAADGRSQRETRHQWGDLAGVEVRRDEAGEGARAQLVERLVALQPDLGAREEGQEANDTNGSADD